MAFTDYCIGLSKEKTIRVETIGDTVKMTKKQLQSYTIKYYYVHKEKPWRRYAAAVTNVPPIIKKAKGENDDVKSVPQRCTMYSWCYKAAEKKLRKHVAKMLCVPVDVKVEING